MNVDRERANCKTALTLGAVSLGMFSFGYVALVPLYNAFCELTGLTGETTVMAEQEARRIEVDVARQVTVSLDANTNSALPWKFAPVVRQIQVHPGELMEATYMVENRSAVAVTGKAVPSVAPSSAASFFRKIECFCFTQQTLAPGERRELPVRFLLEPDLPGKISELTLSYIFYRVDDDVAAAGTPPA